MNWDELTMAQKNELMQTYIKNGVTSLDQMRSHFNSFATGGPKKTFQEWSQAMKGKYPWLELDSNKAGYDYERYFNENYDDAIARLNEAEARHFTDRYKLPNHPTFSDESLYSQGPRYGGTWTNENKFIPSVINTQQYPKIYDQNRAYTEEEIYDRLKHKFDEGGGLQPTYYTVQSGDTLSKIAQQFTGDYRNYLEIAAANGIMNPDLIYTNQKIVIPTKMEGTFKFETIPGADKNKIIQDYPKSKYNYYIAGDKVYYSRKGIDNWADISDNGTARKNLLEHLESTGRLQSYNENEQQILNRIRNNNFDYNTYHDSITASNIIHNNILQQEENRRNNIKLTTAPPVQYLFDDGQNERQKPLSINLMEKVLGNLSMENLSRYNTLLNTQQNITKINDAKPQIVERLDKSTVAPPIKYLEESDPFEGFGKISIDDVIKEVIDLNDEKNKKRPLSYKDIKHGWDKLTDWVENKYELVHNGITRKLEKALGDDDPISQLVYNDSLADSLNVDSRYLFIPKSYTGDTVYVDKGKYQGDRYILPESLNLSEYQFGYRNRGQYEELEGSVAPITIFNSFDKKSNIKNKNGTFIGVDANGNLKIGSYEDFDDSDNISRTYGNVVKELKRDHNGNLMFKDDAVHGNPGRSVPITINYNEDGSTTEGSLNILTSKNKQDSNTYGNVTGGRVIIKTGNEMRLVSGSIDDINNQFEEMKKRNGVDRGTFYTLDNGSYNRGLRIKGRNISEQDLRSYDAQNTGGGNFIYIKGDRQPQYESDTVATPNIRTINDESYKKGHSIENAQKGITVHYTAFDNDDDLNNVTQHFQDTKSQASAHVVIAPNGKRRVFANPNQVTFHAGYSMFNGVSDVNDFMVGVEFQNPGNKPLTQEQINSFIEYAEPIIRQNNIPLENIVTHEEVRKQYKEYLRKNGKNNEADKIPDKHDLTLSQYEQILKALIGSIYGYK